MPDTHQALGYGSSITHTTRKNMSSDTLLDLRLVSEEHERGTLKTQVPSPVSERLGVYALSSPEHSVKFALP